jgi:hypothetical protein
MTSRTIVSEWDSYRREVLVKNGITDETADGAKCVFFAGICSALFLLELTPVEDLLQELEQFAATLPSSAEGHA